MDPQLEEGGGEVQGEESTRFCRDLLEDAVGAEEGQSNSVGATDDLSEVHDLMKAPVALGDEEPVGKPGGHLLMPPDDPGVLQLVDDLLAFCLMPNGVVPCSGDLDRGGIVPDEDAHWGLDLA